MDVKKCVGGKMCSGKSKQCNRGIKRGRSLSQEAVLRDLLWSDIQMTWKKCTVQNKMEQKK